MEPTAPYVDVFCTVHCFMFYHNCYNNFFWFSDPYTFPSERGTEALIKSFFQLTSKNSLPSPIQCRCPYWHQERTFSRLPLF